MFESVVRVRGQLSELVTALDPDVVTGVGARELWAEFDRVERLAAAAKTLLARRVAATHSGERTATRSAAEDLARRGGTSTGAAREALDTSQRVAGLPGVEDALRRGELSAEQAALVAAAAAADPAAQRRLVELAGRVSLKELRDECARVRAAADPDPDATHRRIHEQRRLRRWTDAEGGWNLVARGTAQHGAALNTALDPIIDQIFAAARADGRREPHEAYAFDALIAMADRASRGAPADQPADMAANPAGGAAAHPNPVDSDDGGGDAAAGGGQDEDADLYAGSGGGDEDGGRGAAGSGATDPDADADVDADDTPTADSPGGAHRHPGARPSQGKPPEPVAPDGHPSGAKPTSGGTAGRADGKPPARRLAPRKSVNPRYLALLRIDVAALQRGRVAGEELCEITGVGPVPVSVARGLLGEAIVKLVITKGVAVANVTHLGRGPTAAQKAALLWTSPTCAVQGCDGTRTEWDHRQPWAATRHTRLDELDPLCTFHHDLKTRFDYALVPGVGKRPFTPPDDPRHPRHRHACGDPGGGDAHDRNGHASPASHTPP